MADQGKRKERAGQRESPRPTRKTEPKMKVIESGTAEQGEPIDAGTQQTRRQLPTDREVARAKDREEHRYGGIPLGSDPRE